MWFLQGFLASLLVAFPALLSIVNPFGGALIYSQITASLGHDERVELAWRIARYSMVVMLVALIAGATLMSFFGVSLDALRVAGGAVVAASAWDLLNAPQATEQRKQEQAAPAGARLASSAEVAFFPLTVPFTTGPGTISVAIALSAGRPAWGTELVPFFVGAAIAAAGVAVSVGLCYASADRVMDLIGQARARVLTRLSAFLLLCIGTQILMTGLQGVLSAVLTPRPV
jgi:multiple antibiotic resistance protein